MKQSVDPESGSVIPDEAPPELKIVRGFEV
jgi:hypothetical protein